MVKCCGCFDAVHNAVGDVCAGAIDAADGLALCWQGKIFIREADQTGVFRKMLMQAEYGKTWTAGNAQTAANAFFFV